MNSNLLVSELELHTAKILIIDDEEACVSSVAWTLRKADFINYLSVTDSTRARDTFAQYQPDLVLLDINMPHLDGFGVLQQIRELEAPGDFVPVVILTGEGNFETRRRALAAGASDFLDKPVDYPTLVLRVINALQTRLLHQKIQVLQRQLKTLTVPAKNV
jgi:PleD family two-component response regulator